MQGVWRNSSFLWLVGGQTLSEFGASITSFAIPWLILEITGSAAQMGFAFAVGFLPYLLLSLPAGVFADRYDRKKMMMWADFARMILVSSIPLGQWFGVLGMWQLYVVQAGMSVCAAAFDSAYVACLPNVVSKDELASANSILQTGVATSQILGPPLAGVMIGLMGAADTITVNGLSYLISVLTLLMIRKPFSAQRSTANTKPQMLSQIGEGLAFVWKHLLIRNISLFTMALNFGASAVNAVLLYHLEHNLHVSPSVAGLVMTGFSGGTIVGSLASALIGKRLPIGTVLAVALGGMSAQAVVIGLVPSVIVITVCFFFAGFCAVLWNVQSMTLRQSIIPDELLGRASSAIRMICWGSMPVGSASGGVVAQRFGAPVVFLGVGALQIGIWAWAWFTPLFKMRSATSPLPAPELTVPTA